jgi:hypothetical protein
MELDSVMIIFKCQTKSLEQLIFPQLHDVHCVTVEDSQIIFQANRNHVHSSTTRAALKEGSRLPELCSEAVDSNPSIYNPWRTQVAIFGHHGCTACHPRLDGLQRPHSHGLSEYGGALQAR